jgi:hypothetical protein
LASSKLEDPSADGCDLDIGVHGDAEHLRLGHMVDVVWGLCSDPGFEIPWVVDRTALLDEDYLRDVGDAGVPDGDERGCPGVFSLRD